MKYFRNTCPLWAGLFLFLLHVPANAQEEEERPTNLHAMFTGALAVSASSRNGKTLAGLEAAHTDPSRIGPALIPAMIMVGADIAPDISGFGALHFTETSAFALEAYLNYQRDWSAWKGGLFLTDFGLANQKHAHHHDFVDLPVTYTRLLGMHGMFGNGFEGSLKNEGHEHNLRFTVGLQRPDAMGTPSFAGSADTGGHVHNATTIGGYDVKPNKADSSGDMIYTGRLFASRGCLNKVSVGLSGAAGPNGTGEHGRTLIYGADLRLSLGHDRFVFELEGLRRDYYVDRRVEAGDLERTWSVLGGNFYGDYENKEQFTTSEMASIRQTTVEQGSTSDFGRALDLLQGRSQLKDMTRADATRALDALDRLQNPYRLLMDSGFYAQVLARLSERWSTGFRYEFAGGAGESIMPGGFWAFNRDAQGRDRDPARDTRRRISSLIVYKKDGLRLRLQGNYNDADHLRERRTLLLTLNELHPSLPQLPYEWEFKNKGKVERSVHFVAEFTIASGSGGHHAHH
ncbi:MAG: hypothetical protein HS115_16130 [Spirochaetales bacterium]|nr:hypothetical protein [Spirochaetales bacterium]